MVVCTRRKTDARSRDGARRRQPVARGRDARHQPQHLAQETAAARLLKLTVRGCDAARARFRPLITSHHDQTSSHFRFRQDRRARLRARAVRAGRQHPVHRRHREAAGRQRRAGDRSRRLHRLSRKCSTAASRRCIRKCTAASWRAATCPSTWRRCNEHGIPHDRHGRGQPLPVRSRPWRKPDCSLEDAIENIDIGGPTMLRSAAKNHQRRGGAADPARLRAGAGRDEGRRTATVG